MSPSALAKWVAEALEKSGLSQAELARQLERQLGRSIDRAAVNKMCLTRLKPGQKRRKVAADEMLAIEQITGHAAPAEMRPALSVPLLSSVQAGRFAASSPVAAADILRYVKATDLPPGDWIALEVNGDSMDRVVRPGAIILVNRNDKQLVHEKYYVFSDGNGEATFKLYRANPDRLQPQSTNPDYETFYPKGELTVVGRVYRAITDLN